MRISLKLVVALSASLLFACQENPSSSTGPSADDLSVAAARGAGSARIKSITVAPASATLQTGQTRQLTATTKPASTITIAWTSSNPSVATVNSSGLVTAAAVGQATITASADGKSGTSIITVTSPPPAGSVTMIAAGDIADCTNNNDEATAQLVDTIAGTVAILGDNAYENGSTTDYANCYAPNWGRHKARTMPSAGNHEYQTPNASGYYGYFGTAAGDPAKGYYSYDLGSWHIIVLNSNLAVAAGSAQELWLRGDLQANAGKSCTLAYWHHPRFSSGSGHGNNAGMQPLWQALYDFDADIILGGHDHTYERFAPQTPSGAADNARGIREFVVGTGGRGHYTLGTRKANSEIFDATSFGVLKLTLSAGQYAWQFIPIAGNTFTDSGTGVCH